jgi:hypothetical protein
MPPTGVTNGYKEIMNTTRAQDQSINIGTKIVCCMYPCIIQIDKRQTNKAVLTSWSHHVLL